MDYLSQDIVFKEISNKNFKNDNVPSVLKPMLVSRKFVVERTRNNTFLQFGSGKQGESNVAADPQSVAIDLFGKDYVTDTTFDPTKLSKNENFGVVPSNTVLTITYRSLSVDNSNVAVGKLNGITSVSTDYADRNGLSLDKIAELERSFEVTNEEPITGQTRSPSSGEVKRRIYDTFPTQNRAVTKADYESIVYRMPAKFGSVKRCSVQKDPDSMKRNLNMYVISEDNFGLLTKSNSAIKNNLKTWLDNYRMINDTIDILDAHIFNFGVEFTVSSQSGTNRFSLLNSCVTQINRMFSDGFFIGEAIVVSDIYSELKKVTGVLDVNFVKIVNRSGTRYSILIKIHHQMVPK